MFNVGYMVVYIVHTNQQGQQPHFKTNLEYTKVGLNPK